jgi:hypothetical protein
VDKDGHRVGRNRLDVQYDKDEFHNCVEVDTKPTNRTQRGDRIRTNDLNTRIDLKILSQ